MAEKDISNVHSDPRFKEFIKTVLKQSSLNSKHINLITTDSDMIEWTKVFTSKGMSKYNYELYEAFGDATCNKIVVWYYKQRFSQVFNLNAPIVPGFMGPVDILSKLKCTGVSKPFFGKYARKTGFLEYVRALDEEKIHSQSILEDTFEAFIGCLEHLIDSKIGPFVGYGICYTFMKPLLDGEKISLAKEDLYDPKSLINIESLKFKRYIIMKFDTKIREGMENKDYKDFKNKDINDKEYRERFISTLNIYDKESNALLYTSERGTGSDKQEAEKKTARNALNSGIFNKLDDKYKPVKEHK